VAQESKSSYVSPDFVEHEVNGVTTKFYALSLQVMFDMRDVAKPLLKALTGLFGGVGQENGVTKTRKDHRLADGTSGVEQVEELKGIDSKLAEVKLIDRDKSIHELIDAFADPKNRRVVAKALLDSMRVRPLDDKAVDAFLKDADAKVFVEIATGALKANAGVLGPLGARLLGQIQAKVEAVGQDPVPSESSSA
jgi:hypothetical protein